MRIVHIAHNYGLNNTGGAAIASTRLHQAMLREGVDSHYICEHQMELGEKVYEIPPQGSFAARIRQLGLFLSHAVGKLILPNGFANGFDAVPLFGLEAKLKELKPDIVHIHRTNAEVAPFRQLEKLPYKVVFHLHDIWAFNAVAAYPGKDLRYVTGFTKENSKWFERRTIAAKRHAMEKLKPVFIGPSDWICRCCRSSVVAKGCKTIKVPYVFDQRFDFRGQCHGQRDKFVALFGCFKGTKNKFKGWDDVVGAVRLLPAELRRKMEIHVFGEDGDDFEIEGVRIHLLGNIFDSERLIEIYNSADVFMLASREDNSPLTKFEALYCGLPVLAFDRTGCAEYIEAKRNGWVAKDGDLGSFADGIAYYMDLFFKGQILHAEISRSSRDSFAPARIVAQTLAAYQEKA